MKKKIVALIRTHLTALEYPSSRESLSQAIGVIKTTMLSEGVSHHSSLGASLRKAINIIEKVQTQLATPSNSRSRTSSNSSNSSTASLGERISTHDKDNFLYTYKWVTRHGDNG